MTDILITEPMDEPAVASLRAEFSVIHDPDLSEQPQRIAQLARDCRALIVRDRTRVSAVLLDGCASLVAIGRLGVGLDNIDMDACKQRDVTVYPASGANADAVAEYVIGSIFLCSRRGLMASAEVLAGDWPRVRYIGTQVSGKTLGIIGLGAIGQALAPRATALGLQVIAYDPLLSENAPAWRKCGVEPRSLASLLADSDFVSLHVPLSAATRNLVNASALGRMRATACLINASRGGIVDETALITALRQGSIAGAVLDVVEHEPLPANSHFVDVPNLILTPHIGGATREARARIGAMIAKRVREALLSRP